MKNVYFDLTNICLSCGFPVANAKSKLARYCQFPHYAGKNPCILARDRAAVKATRKLSADKPIPVIVFTDKVKMRGCLCCDEQFLSKGIYNRICEKCR